MKPSITIIILNWNGYFLTKKCLDSLIAINYPNFHIIVADNGSDRREDKLLKERYNRHLNIHFYRFSTNLGYTGGNNKSIKIAQKYNPEFILLLNNDVLVEKEFLTFLVDRATADKKIGIVCPIIMDASNKNTIIFSGGEINWLFAKPYHKKIIDNTYPYQTFVTGCCMLIKNEVIINIGSLDDRFFAYFEDVAYCLNAKKYGIESVCEPRSRIYHHVTASLDKKGKIYTYLISRNRILLFKNYTSSFYYIYFMFYNFCKLILVMIYFKFTKQYLRADAYLKGYQDGMNGVTGKPAIL